MKDIIKTIRTERPLIHHITNMVTISDCARITRYWGALPIMAYDFEEISEVVDSASALVINIGTLRKDLVEVILLAGLRANQKNIPIILDPVGVGATIFRSETVAAILDKIRITVLRGNPAEIINIAGQKGKIKGVESVGEYQQIEQTSQNIAQRYGCIVVASGREDIITDGQQIYKVSNGHPLLSLVVGTGCMLSSTIAVFCSVQKDYLGATLEATAAFGLAAELAAHQKEDSPESFRVKFMDTIFLLDDQKLKEGKRIKSITK